MGEDHLFLRAVPTTWDETRVITAEIGEVVAVARRKGDEWWIGALTNWNPRDIEVKADFLGSGDFIMKSWEDSPNAANEGTDHVVKETKLTKDSKFTIRMVQGGGFAAVVGKGR